MAAFHVERRHDPSGEGRVWAVVAATAGRFGVVVNRWESEANARQAAAELTARAESTTDAGRRGR